MSSIFEEAFTLGSSPHIHIYRHQDYYLLSDYMQLSGIFPLQDEKRTAGYWDDLALVGSLAKNKYAVLGAGILSFAPLLSQMKSDLDIKVFDLNKELLSFLRHILEKHLPSVSSRYELITKNIKNLEVNDLDGIDTVFIDLSDQKGISPLICNQDLHQLLKKVVSVRTVGIHIYDLFFKLNPDLSLTEYVGKCLSPYYQTFEVIRRATSVTLICHKEKNSHFLNHHSNISFEGRHYFENFTPQVDLANNKGLFKFKEQDDLVDGSPYEFSGLLKKVAEDFFDFIQQFLT